MPPAFSRLPSSFHIALCCEAETPECPAFISVSTHPEHTLLESFLTGFVRLAPVLKLPNAQFTVVANLGRNAIAVSPSLPSAPLTGFLCQLAAIGADDLAEIRRQVEGYPYDRIASEYERLTQKANRTRRVMPSLELDASPLLPVRVVDVLGGPATTIRLSPKKRRHSSARRPVQPSVRTFGKRHHPHQCPRSSARQTPDRRKRSHPLTISWCFHFVTIAK